MKLYELYDGEKLLGEYTAKQIEEETGIKKYSVSTAAGNGRTVKKRYRIQKTEDSTLEKKDFLLLLDFEQTAAEILHLCGR